MLSLPQGSVDWNTGGEISAEVANRRSRKGAWIEMLLMSTAWLMLTCRSRKGAWIEMLPHSIIYIESEGRSRKGAWIEMVMLSA